MSVTLNGREYSAEDFKGYGYVSRFPEQLFADLLAELAAGGVVARADRATYDGIYIGTQAEIDAIPAEQRLTYAEWAAGGAGWWRAIAIDAAGPPSPDAAVTLAGQQIAGAVGTPAVSAGGAAAVTPTGQQASGDVGTPSVSTSAPATVTPAGQQASGDVGAPAAAGTIIPAAPSLTNVTNNPAQLTATWTDVSGETSYTLYYRAGAAPTKSTYDGRITGIAAGTTSYTINGPLAAGTTYHVGVTASSASGESAMSGIISAAAAAAVPPHATSIFDINADGWTLGSLTAWGAGYGNSGGGILMTTDNISDVGGNMGITANIGAFVSFDYKVSGWPPVITIDYGAGPVDVTPALTVDGSYHTATITTTPTANAQIMVWAGYDLGTFTDSSLNIDSFNFGTP
jgi:hypothetical protein